MSEKLKQVTDLTLEELLKQVEEATEARVTFQPDLDDVSSFLSIYNIKPGKHKVRSPFLYAFYKQWSKDPVGPHKFAARAKNFFENDRGYYFLDKKAFDIVAKIRELNKPTVDYRKSTKIKKHIEYFFAANGVKKGDFYFPVSILYTLYRTWCIKNHFKVAFKIGRFTEMVKTYFEFKSTTVVMVRITTGILQYLSKEQLEKVNNAEYVQEK